MTKKYDINAYLIMYLIGYSFFFHQVYTQILYPLFGLEIVLPFSITYLIMPIIFLYIYKKMKYKPNIKIDFIYKILSIIYLLITSIIILNYVSIMIHNYYYQDTHSLIICLFLLIPLLYTSIKSSYIYYSLTFIMALIFTCFKLLYGLNINTYDIYPLYNIFKINNYFQVIFLSIPLLLEPLVLLSNYQVIQGKIKLKLILPFAFIISFISIGSILRQTSEFGLLLKVVSFPYYESCKLVTFESNFDNIDYYYLFSLTVSIFARIPLLLFTIKDSFSLKNKGILVVFLIIIICLYFLIKELEFYISIIIPISYIASSITLILFILSLFIKEKRKHAN